MPWHGCCARPSGSRVLTAQAARDRVRDRVPDADPEDLLLLDDLLGIADPDVALPAIDPDARRRRLTALVNCRRRWRAKSPAVYVIEDAHWIDEVSESMLADFLTVIPQTPSLVLVTYRPEYRGALTRVHGCTDHRPCAAERSGDRGTGLELLGPDPSVGGLAQMIAERAAGNPFFAEEIVRELAERGVLRGRARAHTSVDGRAAEVERARHLQATIAARIDRLDPAAKRTLSAAAVIGSRFEPRPADGAGRRTGRRQTCWRPNSSIRSGSRATRVCVPPSADSRGGLRVAAQIGSRRAASARGRRDRSA